MPSGPHTSTAVCGSNGLGKNPRIASAHGRPNLNSPCSFCACCSTRYRTSSCCGCLRWSSCSSDRSSVSEGLRLAYNSFNLVLSSCPQHRPQRRWCEHVLQCGGFAELIQMPVGAHRIRQHGPNDLIHRCDARASRDHAQTARCVRLVVECRYRPTKIHCVANFHSETNAGATGVSRVAGISTSIGGSSRVAATAYLWNRSENSPPL